MKILILDDIHPVFIEGIQEIGIHYNKPASLTNINLQEMITDIDALVVNSATKINQDLINKANKLKWIGRPGSGMENIDIAYCESKNIVCQNSPEGNRNAVAEHTLGMILAFNKNFIIANNQIKEGQWLRAANTGVELSNKKVGIIGYGNVGQTLANLLSSFNCEILVYDKYKTGFSTKIVKECTMQEIFEQADIVSLHIPLTPETNMLGNDAFFNSFKNKILFINTSRGKIVSNESVLKAIKNNKIIGACLDVLENEHVDKLNNYEKKIFFEMANHPKVLITPHIAGWSRESKYKMAKVLLEKFKNNFNFN